MRVATVIGLLWTTALAILFLAPIGASTALAAQEFEAEDYPAAVNGEQVGWLTFSTEFGELECESVTLTGESLTPSEAMTLAPEFSGCTFFGIETTVDPEGCAFMFKVDEKTGEASFSGGTDIVCPEGEAIKLTVIEPGLCDISIDGQAGLQYVFYKNTVKEGLSRIAADAEIFAIHYTSNGEYCPSGEHFEGIFYGEFEMAAELESEAVGLAVAQAKPTKLCKKDPKLSKKACPANEEYGANASVEAGNQGNQGDVKIAILQKPAIVKNTIKCQESKLTGKTKEAVGSPLNVENISVKFGKCATSVPTNCTVTMENEPAPGEFAASVLSPGDGVLRVPMTLQIKCGTEVDCRYAIVAYHLVMLGNNPADLIGIGKTQELLKQVKTPEAGCFDLAEWNAAYEVTKPQPVWLSQ